MDDEGPCGLVDDNGMGLHQQLDLLLGIETLLRDLIGPGKSQQSARRTARKLRNRKPSPPLFGMPAVVGMSEAIIAIRSVCPKVGCDAKALNRRLPNT